MLRAEVVGSSTIKNFASYIELFSVGPNPDS